MSKPTVFVIGTSGYVGTATVKALSTNYADRLNIKAGSRDPVKVQHLKNLRGVEIVQVAMDKPDELVKTLKGSDAAFVVTPSSENRAQIATSAVEAAKTAGVKFVLVVSALTTDLTDTIFGKQFYELESSSKKIGVPVCFLRLPLFIDNNAAFNSAAVKSKGLYIGPIDPDKYCTTTTVSDIGTAAAAILSDPSGHGGKTYNLVSDHYTHGMLASSIGEALGKEVKYFRVSYEDAQKGFLQAGVPQWQTDGILELFKLIDAGSPVTNIADRDDYERITGKKPTSLKAWVEQNIEAFR